MNTNDNNITIHDAASGSKIMPLPANTTNARLSAVLDYLGGSFSSATQFFRSSATGVENLDRDSIVTAGDVITVVTATKGGC